MLETQKNRINKSKGVVTTSFLFQRLDKNNNNN